MPSPVPIVDLAEWRSDEEEPLGARDKEWMAAPGGTWEGTWLVKSPRTTGLPELGADLWAEFIAFGIAQEAGVPAAEVRLAIRHGHRGVISRRIEGDLAHGNELLAARNPNYPVAEKGPVLGYDLDAIEAVLRPYGGSESGLSAFESFAGYLTFDALIGNTDRHHENWAVIRNDQCLAPTYDHGASLGFNVPPRLRTHADSVSNRARSRHFPEFHSLVDLALGVLHRVPLEIRDKWLSRVAGVDEDRLHHLVAEVPSGWMSDSARNFVVELVLANQRRLTL